MTVLIFHEPGLVIINPFHFFNESPQCFYHFTQASRQTASITFTGLSLFIPLEADRSHSIFQVLCNFFHFPRTTKTQIHDQQQLSGPLFHSSRTSVIQASDLKTPNSSLTTVQCPPWLLWKQRARYRTSHGVNTLSAFFPSTEQKYLLSSFASVLTILRALCSHIKPSNFFVCLSYFIPGYSFLLPSFVSVTSFHELLASVLLKHLPLFFLTPDCDFLRAVKKLLYNFQLSIHLHFRYIL